MEISMKCEICGNKLGETFLNKILGAYVKDAKGKKHTVCGACQKNLGSKEKILEKL
jgi:hypothetical protein